MKFIKDIIGEKRERVRLDGSAAPAVEPVQPPAEETGSRAPLSLGHGFRLDPDPAPPAPAAAAPLPEDIRDPLAAPGAIPAEDAAEAFGSVGGNAPDEDAIAAFFAREQSQAEAPSAQDRPDPAAFFAAPDHDTAEADPAGMQGEDFFVPHEEEAEEDTAEPLGAEPDFSRLQQPDPAADTARPYRVFTRSNAAGPDPDTAADRTSSPCPGTGSAAGGSTGAGTAAGTGADPHPRGRAGQCFPARDPGPTDCPGPGHGASARAGRTASRRAASP